VGQWVPECPRERLIIVKSSGKLVFLPLRIYHLDRSKAYPTRVGAECSGWIAILVVLENSEKLVSLLPEDLHENSSVTIKEPALAGLSFVSWITSPQLGGKSDNLPWGC
jgi:hypothetical protein